MNPLDRDLETWIIAAFMAISFASLTRADDLSKPIRQSPDGHYLVQPDGQPFFWLADTAWELFYRLDREETDSYLKDRAAKGYTVILAVATGKLDSSGVENPNRYGQTPFIAGDPLRPNPRYFEHVDWVVTRAAQYGLRIAMLPAWGRHHIARKPEEALVTPGNAESYSRWLAARYRGKSMIWVLGGDVIPVALNVNQSSVTLRGEAILIDCRPVYDLMARGIIAGEGGDPFITYHPSRFSPTGAAPPRMSLHFADRDWLDLNMIQSSHILIGPGDEGGGTYSATGFAWNPLYNYVPIQAEYQSRPTRPILDGEPRYEEHPCTFGGGPCNVGGDKLWHAYDSRNAAYHALFAGAAGHTYGHFDVWEFYGAGDKAHDTAGYGKLERTDWRKALDAPGAGQMKHAKALLLSRPYFARIPDDSIVVGDRGQGGDRISATRDRDGSYAMIYLPKGQAVTVDMSPFSGRAVVGWWFDPRTGKATRLTENVDLKGSRSFLLPPSSGPENDWILVLDDQSRGFQAPGS